MFIFFLLVPITKCSLLLSVNLVPIYPLYIVHLSELFFTDNILSLLITLISCTNTLDKFNVGTLLLNVYSS